MGRRDRQNRGSAHFRRSRWHPRRTALCSPNARTERACWLRSKALAPVNQFLLIGTLQHAIRLIVRCHTRKLLNALSVSARNILELAESTNESPPGTFTGWLAWEKLLCRTE
jgi:hypothetical protein